MVVINFREGRLKWGGGGGGEVSQFADRDQLSVFVDIKSLCHELVLLKRTKKT
jgi:hypothetical protein